MMSVHLEVRWSGNGGKSLGTGTGFIIISDRQAYLITNRHVVSGRRSDTNAAIDRITPDELVIKVMSSMEPLEWAELRVRLTDEAEKPLWYEHPLYGRRVDVVALPIQEHINQMAAKLTAPLHLVPYDTSNPGLQLRRRPSDAVSIVGFPLGRASYGSLPIWSRGYIASEYGLNYAGLPCFLIDARTKPGQSGSPVIAFNSPGLVAIVGGSLELTDTDTLNLLGIYSGRIDEGTDIGMVWRTEVIDSIIEGRMRNFRGEDHPPNADQDVGALE